MKYLKWPLFILLALVLIYVILCLIGPKNMDTSRSTEIKSSPAQVFNLINNLEKWETWSPWSKSDTTQVLTYGNKKEGLGASYTWKGDTNGAGDLNVTESIQNEKTKVTMNFHDYGSTSFVDFDLKSAGDKVNLTWSMKDEKDLPFLLRGMMFIQGMKGSMVESFDLGLSNIKEIAENRAMGKYNGYEIKALEMPEKHFVLNRQEVAMDKISQFYSSNLGSLIGKLQSGNVQMSGGKPSGLFFKWDEANGKTDMAAAIPVADAVSLKGTSSLTIPASGALQIDYYGDFSKTATAHYAMEEYMKDHGLLSNPPVIEEYVTDPSEEQDPTKWLTKIIYYVN